MKRFRRFTLRTSLFLMTTFAITAWWLQRPWQETVLHIQPVEICTDVEIENVKETSTYRKTDFIHPALDGLQTFEDSKGRVWIRVWYQSGRRTRSEHLFYNTDGDLISRGQKRNGVPHGIWECWPSVAENCFPRNWKYTGGILIDATLKSRDQVTATFTYGNGYDYDISLDQLTLTPEQLDEILEHQSQESAVRKLGESSNPKPLHQFRFEHGRLMEVDGEDASQFQWRIPNDLSVFRLAKAIATKKSVDRSIRLWPIESFDNASDKIKRREFISHGPPLPLSAHAYLRLKPYNQVMDFRFGRFVITTLADAAKWKDETGVTALKGDVFDRPCKFSGHGNWVYGYWGPPSLRIQVKALEDMLRDGTRSNIYFDFEPRYLGSAGCRSFVPSTVRNALGILLNRGGLRCRQAGNRVVIYRYDEDPKESPSGPTSVYRDILSGNVASRVAGQ